MQKEICSWIEQFQHPTALDHSFTDSSIEFQMEERGKYVSNQYCLQKCEDDKVYEAAFQLGVNKHRNLKILHT